MAFCNCTRYLHVLCVTYHGMNLNTQKHCIETRVLSTPLACLSLPILAIHSSWQFLCSDLIETCNYENLAAFLDGTYVYKI